MLSTPARTARLMAFGAVRVRRNLESVVARGLDHGADFRFGHLRIRRRAVSSDSTPPLAMILMVSRAFLVTLANRLARGIGTVDDGIFEAPTGSMPPRPAIGGVGMAAGAADRLARRE